MSDETRRMVERMPEPYRSAGLARVDEHDQRRSDELNGAAIRLLCEALPEGWRWGWMTEFRGEWTIGVSGPGAEKCDHGYDHDVAPYRTGKGISIAEAAFKCREALL